MFPKELRFSIHPRELQSAVELLPDPKGKSRSSSSASTELKNKLLQVPVEKLRLWKMKPKMLAMLPYLVVEKDNAALQKRILTISTLCFCPADRVFIGASRSKGRLYLFDISLTLSFRLENDIF